MQPALVHAALAALPPTVRQLRLEVDCRGPLCNLLQRVSALQSLRIDGPSGNGAFMRWQGRGCAAVIPKLTELCLIFRGEPQWDWDMFHAPEVRSVPETLPAAFAAATRLTFLELLVDWDDHGAQLLAALPALRQLR